MNQLGTVYATKRRRRNGKSLKPTPKDGVTKSNPSKRHRERLNAELDTLASLLPFEQNILSKLDRLSILRLSVSYLRTKSYFQVVMHKDKDDPVGLHRPRDLTAFDHTPLDGEMFLQALNGFLMILTCEGEVFFATHSIEGYLGFHQSDIVHQSVYELVHSEDREELQRQLMWNSFLPPESANMGLQDVLLPENAQLLERSFTVRFRCLLDNTSGFLRLDIRGRVKVLHGQNRKSDEPPLALFAICTPFGPPSLLEIPQKEVMFKSKHKLDLALVSMDQRGKLLLGYSDSELANMGGYDLVHYDDLAYVASAHQELLKTGASGMIAYRFQTKDGQWQWLQTSSRLVYKNSKPDFVISTHRPLMEEEGRDLLGKRTMDFKVSYLDAGLPNTYFSESDQLLTSPTSHTSVSCTPTRVNRRYKTQLRDFLSTCRTKRKLSHGSNSNQVTSPSNSAVTTSVVPSMPPTVEYIADGCTATYNMYTTPYATATPDHSLGYMTHSATNFNHTLYPTATALDNRYLTTTENLFHQYRPLSTYYPDYHHTTSSTPYNGFLDVTPRTYDPSATTPTHHAGYRTAVMDDKLYPCHQQVVETTPVKYPSYDGTRSYVVSNNKCLDVTWPYSVSPSSGIIQPVQVMSTPQLELTGSPHKENIKKHSASPQHQLITPKIEEIKQDTPLMQSQDSPSNHAIGNAQHFSPIPTSNQADIPSRQTVLMWGSHNTTPVNSRSPLSDGPAPQEYHQHHINTIPVTVNHHITTVPVSNDQHTIESLKGLTEINTHQWNGTDDASRKIETGTQNSDPDSPNQHHVNHHNHHNSRVVMVL